jgi:hypothetical protein
MSKLMKNTILAVAASLALVAASTPVTHASQPKALLINPTPDPGCYLPKFGFNSFNIGGVGERVTYVQWGGLAAQMGLEPGDLILSVNGFPLSYHGSWNDALLSAMQNGGLVQLTIRDVRTGWLANRQLFLGNGGGYGPITPKYQVTQYGPTTQHIIVGNGGPVGPVTTKKMVGPQNNKNVSINDIVKLFKN